MKQLYIIRGVSGSGKSTFAIELSLALSGCGVEAFCVEADSYFRDSFGNYNFNPEKLYDAHKCCQRTVEKKMQDGAVVIVSNTSTKESELKPYLTLAEKYGYNVTSLIVENRNNTKSIHNVPEETLNASA